MEQHVKMYVLEFIESLAISLSLYAMAIIFPIESPGLFLSYPTLTPIPLITTITLISTLVTTNHITGTIIWKMEISLHLWIGLSPVLST